MKNKKTLLTAILIILSSLCIAGTVLLTVNLLREMAAADEEESAISRLREEVIDTERSAGDRSQLPPDTAEDNDNDPLKRVIDFDTLKRINDDIGFWLFVPGTSIDYPVMVTDSDRYLTYDIFGNAGTGGSLFAYRHSAASDCMFIWGHHASGYERTFTDLPCFLEPEYARIHQKAYLYLPDGSREEYDLCCAFDTVPSDIVFRKDYFKDEPEEWEALVSHMEDSKEYCFMDFEAVRGADRILALATCTDWNMTRRTVVIFVLFETDDKI